MVVTGVGLLSALRDGGQPSLGDVVAGGAVEFSRETFLDLSYGGNDILHQQLKHTRRHEHAQQHWFQNLSARGTGRRGFQAAIQ